MYQIVEEVVFPYGHRLVHHPGGCGRIHGHNGRVQVVVEAETLDGSGYVMDFDALHDALQQVVVAAFDHQLILHEDDPVIPHLRAAGEPFVTLEEHPTAEAIARAVYERLSARGLVVAEVRLYETPTSVAVYRPGR